jgi:hypothetical protein
MKKEPQREGPPYQQSLDIHEEAPQAKHPGQLSYPEWLKQSDTVYHSSFRPDWEEGSMAHVGSQVAASDRLVQSAKNISPRETDDPRGGRTWARRLSTPIAHVSSSDAELNAAEWEIESQNRGNPPRKPDPSKVDFKTDTHILEMAEHLQAGRPVGYRNAFEDVGSTSVLAPKGSMRAWHQDVNEALSMGLDVHPQDATLAKQQFDPAIAITTKSMGHNVEDYANRYNKNNSRFQQQTMLPASTHKRYPEGHPQEFDVIPESERYYPENFANPSEATTDVGELREHLAGKTPAARAEAHAATDPELEVGFGVRDYGPFNWKRHPDELQAAANEHLAGQTHLERAHHSVMEGKRREFNEKLTRNDHFGHGASE